MLSGIPSVSSKHVKAGPLGLFGATVVTKLLRVWVEECRVYRPSSPDPIKDKNRLFRYQFSDKTPYFMTLNLSCRLQNKTNIMKLDVTWAKKIFVPHM